MDTQPTHWSLDPNQLLPGHTAGREAIINAAGLEDASNLRKMLAEGRPTAMEFDEWYETDGENGVWDSPLLHAIKNRRLQNIRLLLEAGVNPNGFPTRFLQEYAKNFDFSSLTREALLQTRSERITPFWAGQAVVPLDATRNGDILHSLVAASKAGDMEAFRLLQNAGAEITSWTEGSSSSTSPCTPSRAAVSTPLHAAIAADHIQMLQYLVSIGLDPNVQPLSVPSQTCTPLQACLLYANPPNLTAFHLLAQHPQLSLHDVTAMTRVHVYHFAIAHISCSLLDFILDACPELSLNATPTSALGHTPLHVACLPRTEQDIQLFSPKCYLSIREIRSLSGIWQEDKKHRRPIRSPSYHGRNGRQPVPLSPSQLETLDPRWVKQNLAKFPLPDTSFHAEQDSVVRRIIDAIDKEDSAASVIAAQDIHGNTALHYLAGHRVPNELLIDRILRHSKHATESWKHDRNKHGFTAEELMQDGIEATEEPSKEFWSGQDRKVLGFSTWPPSR